MPRGKRAFYKHGVLILGLILQRVPTEPSELISLFAQKAHCSEDLASISRSGDIRAGRFPCCERCNLPCQQRPEVRRGR